MNKDIAIGRVIVIFSTFVRSIKLYSMMGIRKYIALTFILLAFFVQVLGAQVAYRQSVEQSANTLTHRVEIGETAYSIAKAYKTTVDEIFKYNKGTENGVQVGQVLHIPIANSTATTTSNVPAAEGLKKHQIEAKETLFSVSQKYGTSVVELLRVNPGLSESTFNIGRIITIPEGNTISDIVEVEPHQVDQAFAKSTLFRHSVGKKETLYAISKKYGCTVDEILRLNPGLKESGLKEGDTIAVPARSKTTYSQSGSNLSLQRVDNQPPKVFYPRDGVVRVALLLPFISGSKTVSKEKITEYYEGFLLAVQRMKEQGLNAEIYTFDIGSDNDTRRLESILGTNELNDLNMIVGGISDKQVKLISKFSQLTGTKYVVPFNNRDTGVEQNTSEFQVANSHSNLFPKIISAFIERFRSSNVIFLPESGSNKNKKDFTDALQAELKRQNINYRVAPTTASITDDLKAVLDNGKKNVIIPMSDTEISLKRALDAVEVVSRDGANVSLFGYPEWQTYINQTRRLHQADTYFYSMFYLDNKAPASQIFSDKYRQWYNKNLVIAYPKFAHMGYDTGMFFLTALQKYGHDFSGNINNLNVSTLQTALHFDSVGEAGGYVNTGVYFVHLKPDNSVEKTEISKK